MAEEDLIDYVKNNDIEKVKAFYAHYPVSHTIHLASAKDSELLRIAVKEGQTDMVKLLIEHGADIHANDNFPLKASELLGYPEIHEFLLQTIEVRKSRVKIDKTQEFIQACRTGNVEEVKALFENKQNIIDIHFNHDNALRHSCWNGHLETVKFLVESGADVHANNDEALHFSCDKGYLETVKYLVESGADIHALNDAPLRYSSGEVKEYLNNVIAERKKQAEQARHEVVQDMTQTENTVLSNVKLMKPQEFKDILEKTKETNEINECYTTVANSVYDCMEKGNTTYEKDFSAIKYHVLFGSLNKFKKDLQNVGWTGVSFHINGSQMVTANLKDWK